MNVPSISKCCKDAKSYFDQVIDDNDTLLIVRSDGQSVVVIPLDQYNSQVETDYLNSSPANRKHLETSMASLKTGNVAAHDLIQN